MQNKDEKTEEKQEVQPNVIKSFGKEFDVNNPIQKAQYETWEEAMRQLHGKQTNELGELRKFHQKLSPVEDSKTLISKVKELQEEGKEADALELVLANQAKMLGDFEEKLNAEKENDKLWSKYFSQRKDLLQGLDPDVVRKYSEQNLGIFDAENPFQVLDSYWLSKAKEKQEFDSATPVSTEKVADVVKTTRPAPEPSKDQETEEVSLDDVFGPAKL